jgi:hypothetical protein
MIKLVIIADVEGWAYDRRAKALQKFAPDDFQVDVGYVWEMDGFPWQDYDIVFNIEYSMSSLARQRLKNTGSKAVLVNSHNADHRRCENRYSESRTFADYIVFNNYEAFAHFGKEQGTCNISNGVDLGVWGSDENDESPRMDKSLWTGSAGKGLNDFLLPLKLQLHGKSEMSLRPIGRGGWDKETKKPDPEVVWPAERMRKWYNSAKVVLCCSHTEATPNYVLEGMACGLVPVTTRVGNAMEFGVDGENCVFADRSLKDFSRAIEYAIKNYDRMSVNCLETISKWSWESRSKVFYDLFRKLVSGSRPEPFSYKELEDGESIH